MIEEMTNSHFGDQTLNIGAQCLAPPPEAYNCTCMTVGWVQIQPRLPDVSLSTKHKPSYFVLIGTGNGQE